MHDLDKSAIASLLCLSLQSQPVFGPEDLTFDQSVLTLRAPGSTFTMYLRDTVYSPIALFIDADGCIGRVCAERC